MRGLVGRRVLVGLSKSPRTVVSAVEAWGGDGYIIRVDKAVGGKKYFYSDRVRFVRRKTPPRPRSAAERHDLERAFRLIRQGWRTPWSVDA